MWNLSENFVKISQYFHLRFHMVFHKLCEKMLWYFYVKILWKWCEKGVPFHMVFHTVEEHEKDVK